MTSDFYALPKDGGCKYKEILGLYEFCREIGIDAELEYMFDGFKLCFPNGGDFVQHYASCGGENGYVEPAIGCNRDYTAVMMSMAKLLVRKNKDRLNREVRRAE